MYCVEEWIKLRDGRREKILLFLHGILFRCRWQWKTARNMVPVFRETMDCEVFSFSKSSFGIWHSESC